MAENIINKMSQPIDPITGTPDFFNQNPAFRTNIKQTYESFNTPMRQELGNVFEPFGGVKKIDRKLDVADLYDIPEAREGAQSGLKATANAFGQLATETTLGGLEAIGYALDFEELFNAEENARTGFNNWLSNAVRPLKESVHENIFPVYQSRAALEGTLSERMKEGSFWAAQGRTVGTSLSLMLPALGAGALMTTGVGAAGGSAMAANIIGAVTSGLMSRKAESAMEAYGSFEEHYNKFLGEGLADEEARERAGNIAADIHKANAMMLPVDILQYMTLLKPMKGFVAAKDAMLKTTVGKIAKPAFNVLSEAAEEAYQFVAAEEATAKEMEGIDMFGEGFGKRLGDYVKDPEFQVSAMLGGMMGGLFDFVGGPVKDKAAVPAARRALLELDRYNAKKMRAAFLGDVESFNNTDREISNKIIAKNLIAGRLDTLSTELDNLLQGVNQDESVDAESKKEITDKFNKIKKDIKIVSAEDKKLQQDNEKYRENRKLRNSYTLNRLEFEQIDDIFNNKRAEYSKLTSLNVDPKDQVVQAEMELFNLGTQAKDINRNPNLSEKQKADQIEVVNKNIAAKEESRKSLINQIKQEDPAYDPKEYSNTRREEMQKMHMEMLHLKVKKATIGASLKRVQEMNKEQAAKEEENLNKQTKDNLEKDKKAGTEAVVSSATTVDEKVNVASNIDGGKEAIDSNAKKKGFVSNVRERTSESTPVELGKEEVFTPVAPRAVENTVSKKDVVEDGNGNTYEVVAVERDGKTKEIKSIKVQDSAGNTKYVNPKDVAVVGKLEQKAVEKTDKAGIVDISKIYSKDGKEVDNNKTDAFVSHMNKLHEDIQALFGDAPDISVKENIDKLNLRNLDTPNKLLAVTEALKALQQHPEIGQGVKNYLNEFYKKTQEALDSITVPVDRDAVSPEPELVEGQTEQDAFENKIEQRDMTDIVAEHWHYKFQDGKTQRDSETREPIESEPYIKSENYSKEKAIRPDVGKKGSEVSLEVDLDMAYNKRLIDAVNNAKEGAEKEAAIDNLINKLNVYVSQTIDGKMTPISVLRSPDRPSIGGISQKNRALREAIYNQIKNRLNESGAIDTGIVTKVLKKFGDSINNRAEYVTPDKVYEQLSDAFKPTNSKKPILGVVRTSGGQRVIQVPNMSNITVPSNINLPTGSVVMILRDSAGNSVPIYLPVKKFRELSQEVYDKLFTQIETLVDEILNAQTNADAVTKIKELQKIVYVPIRTTKKGNKRVIVFTKNKSYNVRSLYNQLIGKQGYTHSNAIQSLTEQFENDYTQEQIVSIIEGNKNVENIQAVIESKEDLQSPEFKGVFDELRMQVDKTELNTRKKVNDKFVDYNQQIFNEGRVVTNINPAMPFHSPMFSLSENFQVKGEQEMLQETKTPEEAKEPTEGIKFVSAEGLVFSDPNALSAEELGEITSDIDSLNKEEFAEVLGEIGVTEHPTELETDVLPDTSEELDKDKESKPEEIKKDIEEAPLPDAGDELPLFRIADDSIPFTPTNLQEEIDWLKSVLPVGEDTGEVRLEIVDTLITIGDKKAWGMFSEDLIKIYDGALAGTVYHEAFHAVFNMALNNSQREAILKEASRKYKTTDRLVLEERLAEEFTKFVQNNGKVEMGIGERLLNFFKRLWYMITNRLDRNPDIQSLFTRINNGTFKDAKFTKSDAVRLSEKSHELLTDNQRVERVNNLTNAMTATLKQYLNLPENKGRHRVDIIKDLAKGDVLPVEELLKIAVKKIVATRKAMEAKQGTLSPELDFQLRYMITQTFELNPDGTIPEGKLNVNWLGREAIRQFAYIESIVIKLNTGEQINGAQLETDEIVFEKDEEINKVEHWQLEAMQLSRKDGAPAEVRRELSYIREKDANGQFAVDSIGFPKYMSFGSAFATLIREVSDTTSSKEMLDKIGELAQYRSEFKAVHEALTANRQMLTKFYNGLQGSHANFQSTLQITNDNGQTTAWVISSDNRNRIDTVISSAWRAGLYDANTANKALSEIMDELRTLEGDALTAAQKKFAESKLAKDLKILFDTIKPTNVSTEEGYNKASQVLQEFGIDVRPHEIKDMGHTYKLFYSNIAKVVNNILVGVDPYTNNVTGLKEAVKNYKNFKNDLFESSFQNLERKTQYAHVKMGFMIKKLSEYKNNPEAIREFFSDPLYVVNPSDVLEDRVSSIDWFDELLYNEGFKENFDYAILGGIKNSENNAVPYNKMTAEELDTVRLNHFFNNSTEGWAYYMVPTLADSPTGLFLKAKRLTKDDAVKSIVRLLRGERNRVQSILDNPDKAKGVKFYEEHGKNYVLFPELADLHNKLAENTIDNNRQEVEDRVRKYLDNMVDSEIKRLKDSGLITEEKGILKSEFIDPRAFSKKESDFTNKENIYQDVKHFIESYVYNSVPATAQTILMFSGDVAMYKNPVDFFKRQKQIWTPVTRLDVGAEFNLPENLRDFHSGFDKRVLGHQYTGVYVKDLELVSTVGEEILNVYLKAGYGTEAYTIAAKLGYSNYYQVINETREKPEIKFFDNLEEAKTFASSVNSTIKYLVKDKETGVVFKTTNNKGKEVDLEPTKSNFTDGQTFIHPRRYSDIHIGLGTWYEHNEVEYQKMMRLEKSSFTTEVFKPFTFGFRKSEDRGVMIPYQHKNSEYTLRPDVAYLTKDGTIVRPESLSTELSKEERYANYVAPQLAEIFQLMDERAVDTFHYTSVVKVGEESAVDMNNLDKAIIHSFDNSDYGVIQETPAHYTDDTNNFGVQLRKLAIADLPANFTTTINGKALNRSDVVQLWQDIISEDVTSDFAKVSKEFEFDKEAFNKGDYRSYNESLERIQKLIINNLRDRNKGIEAEKAFNLVTDASGKKRFAIPLYDPIHAKTTEALIGAIYRNQVVKQKVPGGSLVQVSAVGFHQDLSIKFNEDGSVAYYEAALPFWSKKHMEPLLDKDGNVDISKVKDPKILELVGYRIPTEGKYSMVPMRVKRFLPREAGGTVLLPLEITAITGSDFDIDKMYIMLQSLKSTKIDRKVFKEALKKFKEKNLEAKETYNFTNNELDILLDQIENSTQPLSGKELVLYDFYTDNIDKFGKLDVERVQYDNKKSPSENSRAARDNMKLDLLWSILTNPSTNEQLLFPGENSKLDNLAEEIAKARGISDNINFLDPSTTTKMFERNMTGAGLIGIFANHNVNHAILQHGNVEFVEGFEYGGKMYDNLSQEYIVGSTKERVSANLAMFLRAILDNAKNPVSALINLNSFTADIYATMLRLGMPMESVIYFLNQPAVIDFYNTYKREGADTQAYNKALETIQKALQSKIPDGTPIRELNDDIIKKHVGIKIEDSTDAQFASDQLSILYQFDDLYKASKSLGKIVQIFRADDTKRQITTANNEVFQNNYKEALELEKPFGGVVTGLRELLADYNMMATFKEYGVDKTSEVLNIYYPFNSPVFVAVKDKIRENLTGYKTLSAEQIEYINFSLLNYMVSNFEFFNPNTEYLNTGKTERDYFITKFPKDFQALKKKYPEINNYDITKHVEFISKEAGGMSLDRLNFRRTGSLSGFEMDRIQRSWSQMLNHKEPAIKNFAEALVKYTYYAHGFSIEAGSFTNIIPVEWRAYLKEAGVNGKSYNDFLENMFEASKVESNKNDYNNFIRQFFQHEFFNKFFVPRMDKQKVATNNKRGQIKYIKNEPASMFVSSKTDKDFIKEDSRVTMSGQLKPAKFLRYISIEHNKKVFLMEAVGIQEDLTGGTLVGDTEYRMEYRVIPTKGRKGLAKEYNFNSTGMEPSLIPSNNVVNTEYSSINMIPSDTQQLVVEQTNTPKANIPQNLVSGVESFGTKQEANSKAKELLGSNPHSIDMIEAGIRTRTTRSVDEMQKYNIKVGDVVKQFGKSADGTTKNILTRVTAIHPKGTPGFLNTWEKEGWTAEGVEAIRRYNDGAAAIEFEVVQDTPVAPPTKVVGEEISTQIDFQEEQSSGYRNRTIKNASADTTIALAIDFNSAGEKLTKSSVLSQKKQYIDRDLNQMFIIKDPFNPDLGYELHDSNIFDMANGIVQMLNKNKTKSLNIAGNGIYTMKGKYDQNLLDEAVLRLLEYITLSDNLDIEITSIRTGGQTGIDEAGAKAGIKLGIPTTILAPKGWTFRNIEGKDISNEQQFKARFSIERTLEVVGENISSKGSEFAKKLTNPGNNLQVEYKGYTFRNAEHAYQTFKSGEFDQAGYDLKGGKVKGGKIATGTNVSITKTNWTKDSPKENPNTAYIFTENINSIGSSRVGGGSAVIRNNPNAIGIVTKKYYVYTEDRATSKITDGWNQDFQDTKEDFELFKKVNLEQFAKIDKYESKIFPQGFASDLAKLPTKFAEWLRDELLNRYGLITELNQNKTGLVSKGVKSIDTFSIMTDILTEKLKQHPDLVHGISERGGLDYINSSTHNVTGDKFWESSGGNNFIKALAEAYSSVQPKVSEKSSTESTNTIKNIFTVKPIQSADEKAKSKAKIATQYIGFAEGIEGSSTALYAKQISEQSKKEIKGINISSRSTEKLGKRLTNPNWYAKDLMDVETPYKANASKIKAPQLNAEEALKYDMNLMYNLQVQKFRKNPELIDEINNAGGLEFIKNSSHIVGVKNSRWEGKGMESNFIKVLAKSYETVAKELNKFQESNIKSDIVNSGNYSSSDVVFVSVAGKRGNEVVRKQQQDRTIREAIKALDAGATLITDNAAYVESNSYNEGEKRLAANLKAKGYVYSETTVDGNVLGVWNKFTNQIAPPTKVSEKSSTFVKPDKVEITYEVNGKRLPYTVENFDSVDSIKITNQKGEEVYKDINDGNRRMIWLKANIRAKNARVVEYQGKGKKDSINYIVFENGDIYSAAPTSKGKKMEWAANNGDRLAILNLKSKLSTEQQLKQFEC